MLKRMTFDERRDFFELKLVKPVRLDELTRIAEASIIFAPLKIQQSFS
jgi:hypothetical protein